jgi:LmbE family N-acetylglucosaminyl deacetylase
LAADSASALPSEPEPASAILQDLHSFQQLGTVLFVAAHPDDENTLLLAYLSRGRGYRTAYLSMTRGDGGQNVLGPQFGEELGVIRTQELLAARRIDGARQFFTRAIDFGFSKDYRETLRIWDEQQVLNDVVRIVRSFRPDVIITRFSPQPGGNHGHHIASAVLAIEAFKRAGDPNSFAEQLVQLKPWQPKRVLWNGWRGPESNTSSNVVRLDVGGDDSASGESFASIAGRSRSMHKTQGFGNFNFGGSANRGPRNESFQLLAGEPATNDIMDGVNTKWTRVAGGAEIDRLAENVISAFKPDDVAASVPALLNLRVKLAALPEDSIVAEKRRQLDRILQACLGLSVETLVPSPEVVPGEVLQLRHTGLVRSKIPVRWTAVRYPSLGRRQAEAKVLKPNETMVLSARQKLPANTPLSQPYWLRQPHPQGTYRVENPALIGQPENPPAFPNEFVFEVSGQTLVVPDEPVAVVKDYTQAELRHRLDVIAPTALAFASEVRLFAPGSTRPVEVEVTAFRRDVAGTVELSAPSGWRVQPASRPFQLSSVGERVRCAFSVTAPNQAATADLAAHAQARGTRFGNEHIELRFSHIPPLLLQPTAQVHALSLDLAIHAREVGYLPGAGDSVAQDLAEMGCHVTELSGADLVPERLRGLDSVVVGVRAFNVRTDLVERLPALFAYVEAGGNVIVQYNRPNGLKTNQVAPYDLRLSDERVTDEEAPVTFLSPNHPVLNAPNKITQADFAGWVQERGVYFPNQWDDHFTPILACNDPGESPKKGSLLIAQYGRGYFVYTGLAWFRQLPSGVPGAYRLFANLLSLGK